MANSDVIIPRHVADPDRKFSRADDGGMKHAIARYAQRYPDQQTALSAIGALSLHELRGLEDDVESAAERGLRGDRLRDVARAARSKREAAISELLDRYIGAARDQQLPQLRAELAAVPSVNAAAEREVRDRLWTRDDSERDHYVRETSDATVLTAVLNSPMPLVSDSTRALALDRFNRTHRRELFERADFVDGYVQTAQEIADMVRRTFDDVAPR